MTKDDPIADALVDKFFNSVINVESDEALRVWLRQQPADEVERFLGFWNWTNFTDREVILRQELKRKRRIERFEQLGEQIIRADMAQGGHRHVGGTPKVRELAREWLAEKEREMQQTTQAAIQNNTALAGHDPTRRSQAQDGAGDRVERWIVWSKSHPVISTIIILGTVIIAIGAFTDALTNLIDGIPVVMEAIGDVKEWLFGIVANGGELPQACIGQDKEACQLYCKRYPSEC